MTIVWNETQGDSGRVVCLAECAETEGSVIYDALAQAVEKAVSLLADNIRDESRYFLFEWDTATSTLTIVVTDDDKKNDSPKVVQITLSGVNDILEAPQQHAGSEWTTIDSCSENVQFLIRDYLTTSSVYHQYSLIAVFHNGSRDKTNLL